MGHIPEDDNFDEFMNASAEEWSKSEEPPARPSIEKEPTDRWGSPVSQGQDLSDPNRWGSEPLDYESRTANKTPKKGGMKWWIIVLIVVVMLCLCACIVTAGLQVFNIIELF